jgi:hypothetical protein
MGGRVALLQTALHDAAADGCSCGCTCILCLLFQQRAASRALTCVLILLLAHTSLMRFGTLVHSGMPLGGLDFLDGVQGASCDTDS